MEIAEKNNRRDKNIRSLVILCLPNFLVLEYIVQSRNIPSMHIVTLLICRVLLYHSEAVNIATCQAHRVHCASD
jgi:hypothetical protein